MTIHPTPQNPPPVNSVSYNSGLLTFVASIDGIDYWFDSGDPMLPLGVTTTENLNIYWISLDFAEPKLGVTHEAWEFVKCAIQLLNP